MKMAVVVNGCTYITENQQWYPEYNLIIIHGQQSSAFPSACKYQIIIWWTEMWLQYFGPECHANFKLKAEVHLD